MDIELIEAKMQAAHWEFEAHKIEILRRQERMKVLDLEYLALKAEAEKLKAETK